MATEREWYHIPGYGDVPNMEAACEVAKEQASRSDGEVTVFRCVRTPVRSFKRDVSVTETDLTTTDVSAA